MKQETLNNLEEYLDQDIKEISFDEFEFPESNKPHALLIKCMGGTIISFRIDDDEWSYIDEVMSDPGHDSFQLCLYDIQNLVNHQINKVGERSK